MKGNNELVQKKKNETENVIVKTTKNITGRQSLLMIPLTKFFCQKKNIDKLLEIIEGRSKISLRLIDWFVVNYAKKYNIIYNKNYYNKNNKKEKNKQIKSFDDLFIVFNDYKSQLKEVSKRHFDPFCRRERIHFYYNKDNYILTTVGQLNFFKWAIENNVLEYINDNLKEIDYDMNLNSKKDKDPKNEKEDRKNQKDEKLNKNEVFMCDDNKSKKRNNQTQNNKNKSIKKNSGKFKKDSKKDNKKDKKDIENKEQKEDNTKETKKDKKESKKNNIIVKKNKTTQRKKRKELSESASKSIIKYHYPITIKFD